jgi:hypothetical protein
MNDWGVAQELLHWNYYFVYTCENKNKNDCDNLKKKKKTFMYKIY